MIVEALGKENMRNLTLDAVFGNTSATRVLLFLQNYGEAYASRVARTYGDMAVSRAKEQLDKLEVAGLIVSRMIGRSRVYEWNQRNPTVAPLRDFLQSILDSLSPEIQRCYFRQRQRPRRQGKDSVMRSIPSHDHL